MTTTLQQLKEMNKREIAIWASTVKADDLKAILKNENLGGGISKFKKADLLNIVLDLVEEIETELTKQLKPNPKEKTPRPEAERLYRKIRKNPLDVFEVHADTLDEFETKYLAIKKIYEDVTKYFNPDNQNTGNKYKFTKIQALWKFSEELNNKKKTKLKKLQRKTA